MDVYLSAHGSVRNDKIIMVPKNGEKEIRVHFLNILGYITYDSPMGAHINARNMTKIKPFLTISSGNVYPEMNFSINKDRGHEYGHFIYMINKDKKPICLYEEEIIEKYFEYMKKQKFYNVIPVPSRVTDEEMKSNYIKKYFLEHPIKYINDFILLNDGINIVVNFYNINKEFKSFYDEYLNDIKNLKDKHRDFCDKIYDIEPKIIKEYNDDDWNFLIPNEFNEIFNYSGIELSMVIDKIIEKNPNKEIDLYVYSCAKFSYLDACPELSFLENIDRRESLATYHIPSEENPRRFSTRLGTKIKEPARYFNFRKEENYVKNFENINLINIVKSIEQELKEKQDYVREVESEVKDIESLDKEVNREWSTHFIEGKMDDYLESILSTFDTKTKNFREKRGYEWYEIFRCVDLNKQLKEIKEIYSKKTPVIKTADICRLLKFYKNIRGKDNDVLEMFVCLQKNDDTPPDAAFGTVLALAFGR